MDPALRKLICENIWTHPMQPRFELKFNQDGTGEAHALGDMGLGPLFSLSMQWKAIPESTSTADIMSEQNFRHLKHTNMLTSRPTLLGSSRLEIQLDPNVPEGSGWSTSIIRDLNDRMLLKTAYLPRQFTVVIEKGNFAAAEYAAGRCELRMTFDTSPYPSRDAYNQERKRGPPPSEVYGMLSETNSFYAGKASDELLMARATEDDTVMGYHTSNCMLM